MRYVITGASGHIGNNLVRAINKRFPDAEVVVLTRREIKKELNGATCRQVIGNLEDKQFFKDNILTGDRVIHAAGLIDMTNKRVEETYKINFVMTKDICDVARSVKVDKFVFISSVDAIYRTGKEPVIKEPDDYFPQLLKDCYGKSKAMASKYVLEKMKEDETFNASIVLPTAVLGGNDYRPSEAGKIIISTLKGKTQFGIKGGYNFVNVTDVCQAVLNICEGDKRGQYIISGEDVTVKQLYLKIDEYKSLKKRPIILPTFIAILAIPFVKTLTRLMIKALQDPHNYSAKKAEEVLKITPTPFMETLRETVDWHEKNSL